MANKRKTWGPSSSRQEKSQVPDSIKVSLKEKADEIIKNILKPEYIKPAPADNDFNYLVDIYSKWYKNYFYFCAKYNSPSPSAISPSFETKFARMEYVGSEKFNLSYMRHTEQWFEIYQGLSMLDGVKLISEGGHFMP